MDMETEEEDDLRARGQIAVQLGRKATLAWLQAGSDKCYLCSVATVNYSN